MSPLWKQSQSELVTMRASKLVKLSMVVPSAAGFGRLTPLDPGFSRGAGEIRIRTGQHARCARVFLAPLAPVLRGEGLGVRGSNSESINFFPSTLRGSAC